MHSSLCVVLGRTVSGTVSGTVSVCAYWDASAPAYFLVSDSWLTFIPSQMQPLLLKPYTTTHALTLSYLSLTLTNFFFPMPLHTFLAFIPNLKVDAAGICRDLDNAWDDAWEEKCRTGLVIVHIVSAVVVMGAQWWAWGRMWRWSAEVRRLRDEEGEVEKCEKRGV
jgi:hypothetical protein